MGAFETTAIAVPCRHRCEDRVKVLDFADGVVLVVADGAGGTSAGDQAAETVIREINSLASLAHDQAAWCGILRQTDCRIGAGESTCVVAACSPQGIVGASVGDSRAWFIANGTLEDLTRQQIRKPLLGSGAAVPTGFSHPTAQGLLLVATDGFCNYVRRDQLLKDIIWTDFVVLARKLVEMVRLPSGDLWDDVGIIACRPRRPANQRRRLNLADLA